MSRNKRRFLKNQGHTCWIDVEHKPERIMCRLSEISELSARLEYSSPADLPDQFVLLFTIDGTVSRKCRIVERMDSEVEIEFLA